MLTLVGLPLFFMELSFGQFASLGPITIWKVNTMFKGLGWGMVLVTFIIALYYNVIIAYCLHYLFASMTSELPWATCDREWNTDNCTSAIHKFNSTPELFYNCSGNVLDAALIPLNFSTVNCSNFTVNQTRDHLVSSTEEYFYNYVLKLTSGIEEPGALKWDLCLCLLLAWIVVFLVLIKGIQSLGKVVYFTATFPYILLTILLVYGLNLPGAIDGVLYYITPQWEELLNARVWSDAATQIFYSLSTCSGGLIAMSSYNKFNNNILRDSLIVPVVNCFTSIFAGFVIFSVLGYMAQEKGVGIAEVAEGGPGLAFIVYPEAIARMPVSPLWAILFFFMMTILGFSSQFSMMETVISSISDELHDIVRASTLRSVLFRGAICLVGFFLGLPMCLESGLYLLNLVDVFIGGFPLLIVGLLECIAINYIYGYERFSKDIKLMIGHTPGIYWRVCWCGCAPLIMATVIVFKGVQYEVITYEDYKYPLWAEGLGWLTAMFPVVVIFGWMLIMYCYTGGWKACIEATKPSADWGPENEEDRKGRYARTTVKQEMRTVSVSVNGTPVPASLYQDGIDNKALEGEEKEDQCERF